MCPFRSKNNPTLMRYQLAILAAGALAADFEDNLQQKVYVDVTQTVFAPHTYFAEHFASTEDVYVTVAPPVVTDVTVYVPAAPEPTLVSTTSKIATAPISTLTAEPAPVSTSETVSASSFSSAAPTSISSSSMSFSTFASTDSTGTLSSSVLSSTEVESTLGSATLTPSTTPSGTPSSSEPLTDLSESSSSSIVVDPTAASTENTEIITPAPTVPAPSRFKPKAVLPSSSSAPKYTNPHVIPSNSASTLGYSGLLLGLLLWL